MQAPSAEQGSLMEVYRTRLAYVTGRDDPTKRKRRARCTNRTQVTRHTFDGIGYINDVMPDVWVGCSCAQVVHTATLQTPIPQVVAAAKRVKYGLPWDGDCSYTSTHPASQTALAYLASHYVATSGKIQSHSTCCVDGAHSIACATTSGCAIITRFSGIVRRRK